MNKNISVWRGVLSPPTQNHIWIKDDSSIYIYKNSKWQQMLNEATQGLSGLMSKEDKQILDTLKLNLRWN